MTLHLGECDSCLAWRPLRSGLTPYGDASACAVCRGGDLLDVFEEFEEIFDQAAERATATLDGAK